MYDLLEMIFVHCLLSCQVVEQKTFKAKVRRKNPQEQRLVSKSGAQPLRFCMPTSNSYILRFRWLTMPCLGNGNGAKEAIYFVHNNQQVSSGPIRPSCHDDEINRELLANLATSNLEFQSHPSHIDSALRG